MTSFEDNTEILCSGIIEYPCEDDPSRKCRGYILFPCGATHETHTEAQPSYQLPYRYQIWRERARLSPCCYWQDDEVDIATIDPTSVNRVETTQPDIFEFNVYSINPNLLPTLDVKVRKTDGSEETKEIANPDNVVVGGWLHESVPSFFITPRSFEVILNPSGSLSVTTKCKNINASRWNQGLDNTPPCNGAKTGCPFFTNRTLKYINDEQTAPGKGITGQMIQELRSLLQDWTQEQWEEAFDIPYIWGKDFDDTPMLRRSDFIVPGVETPVYTILTQIYWDVEERDVQLIKFPSAAAGTPQEDLERLDPPDFPTIVNELGTGEYAPIKITFPPLNEQNEFTYYSFKKDSNKLYLAGLSLSLANIYIINTKILTDFRNLRDLDLNSAEVSEYLNNTIPDLVKHSLTFGNMVGFKYTTVSYSRFWELQDGIELQHTNIGNDINTIYCLVKYSDKWNLKIFDIHYKYYHCDIVQTNYPATLHPPETRDLSTRIVGLYPRSRITFELLNIAAPLYISKIYHYFIFDRSLTNFVKEKGPDKPNERFWKVIETFNETLTGTFEDNTGDLSFTKLDYCNKLLVEILRNDINQITIPAGLDRCWEPSNIFIINTDVDGNTTNTEMKVNYRELDGSKLPMRFVVIEPTQSGTTVYVDDTTQISMDVRMFSAALVTEEGEDILPELLEEFNDDNTYLECGMPIIKPEIGDVLKTAHTIIINDASFDVEPFNKFDMSYMVELANEDGQVVGRKWVVGIGEISDLWVRDVEIYYKWSSKQSVIPLLPDYYRYISGDLSHHGGPPYDFSGGNIVVNRVAGCSDHDPSLITKGGGLLYTPYEVCEYPTIRNYGIAAMLEYYIPNMLPQDEKYRGLDFNEPVAYRFNGASLINECIFINSYINNVRSMSWWSGRARYRGPVNAQMNVIKFVINKYLEGGFPPSGNQGREHLRIGRTAHYREYLYRSGNGELKVKFGWLPLVPFISSNSLFVDNQARNFIEQTINTTLSESIVSDYNDYDQMLNLLNRSIIGEDPAIIGSLGEETLTGERKKFDDVYKIHFVRSMDGKGTRWPYNQRYYYTFRSPFVVWAWPEPNLGVVRKTKDIDIDILSNTTSLIGISINKQTTDDEKKDMYNRLVSIAYPENIYKLYIMDQKYDEQGNILEYAKVYTNEFFPLYFDRYTGVIKTKRNPVAENEELYAHEEFVDIVNYYENVLQDYNIRTYFKTVFQSQDDTLPEGVSGFSEFINEGNLYLDPTDVVAYFVLGPDAEDENDISWYAFTPSLKINNIFPSYLPKKQIPYKDDGNAVENSKATVLFSTHYEIEDFNNVERPSYLEDIFTTTEPSLKYDWKPTISGNSMYVELHFNYLLEFSYISLKTETYRLQTTEINGNTIETPLNINEDPEFSIKLHTNGGEWIDLVSKPRQTFNKLNKTTLEHKYIFAFAEEDLGVETSKLEEPIVIDRIRFLIGSRLAQTGFRLSDVAMKVLILNTAVVEEFIVHEPQYLISVGHYSDGDDLHQWSQDVNKITGTVSNLSEGYDELEFQGIAEFWRPLDFNKAEVATEGKLRRHWANQIKTYDYYKYAGGSSIYSLEDVEFYDATVNESEERQGKLLEETLTKLNSNNKLTKTYRYLLLPYDTTNLNKLQYAEQSASVDVFSGLNIVIDYTVFDITSLGLVSIGTQTGLWQDPGIQACFIGVSNDCGGAYDEPFIGCRPEGGALGHISTYMSGSLFTHAVYRAMIESVSFTGAANAIQSGQSIIDADAKIREANDKINSASRYDYYKNKQKEKYQVYNR